MKLKIAWLYPNLMGTYGDRGNILALVRRCQWRGIEVEVLEIGLATDPKSLDSCNLIFMGGAQDRQQKIVAEDILENKGPRIVDLINGNTAALFVCASYQFMGRYYKTADGQEIPGLGLFDLTTENPGTRVRRCIGNITIKLNFDNLPQPKDNYQQLTTLVGFENHGGRTYLGKGVNPLGKVLRGFGNNGEDGTEGAIYKNAIGCYFHGPLLPRNPHLSDYLIAKSLRINIDELSQLDDALELKAHTQALK